MRTPRPALRSDMHRRIIWPATCHHHGMLGRLIVALVWLSSVARAEAPAVDTGTGKGDVPDVPSFELAVPSATAKGVQQLRAVGRAQFLEKDIAVRGYVTWIYDCATEMLRPGKTRAEVQRQIDDDPTLCERKKLYLGDLATTPPERALWVVDVPRPPNKLEKARLPKAEIAAWPKVPVIKVGDYVEITGKFAVQSPHSETNSDGLLVFAGVTKVKPGTPTVVPPPAPVTVSPLVPPKAPTARLEDATKLQTARGMIDEAKGESALDAIALYRKALAMWDDASTWYELGMIAIVPGDWETAKEAFGKAHARVPTQPVYAMAYGEAIYVTEYIAAREAKAKRDGTKEEYVRLTEREAGLDMKQAQQVLEYAAQLAPTQWRTHFVLGKIHRARGDLKAAAAEFSLAVARRPNDVDPYVALSELYRSRDYLDEALAVALAGTTSVKRDYGRERMWFALGMVYDAKRDDAKAVEAFTKAGTGPSREYKATFQRGQVYVRMKQWAKARADLELFLKQPPLYTELEQRLANKLLIDIGTKK